MDSVKGFFFSSILSLGKLKKKPIKWFDFPDMHSLYQKSRQIYAFLFGMKTLEATKILLTLKVTKSRARRKWLLGEFYVVFVCYNLCVVFFFLKMFQRVRRKENKEIIFFTL